jgi:hypothetical protein
MVYIQKIKEIREDTWALILLVLCFIYLFTISLISKGLYGDTDSIAHYHIARYAFKYPILFVDQWGKPLFTTLSAPFAQFGLQGSILFNILCGLLSAWLIYRIARELNYRYALAAIPFSLFAPTYMINLFTSLTEILFGLVLVAGIYFFLKQKSILSAIIISFIPYARAEGMMFPVMFLLAFILVRKYRAIPFLFTGFILFSFAGYFHYKDPLWFFTAMPYTVKGSDIYGSGSFWFYFDRFYKLMGLPLTVLAGIGLIHLVTRLFKDNKPSLSTRWVTQYYLVIGSFFAFILAQSFLWWQGMFGVLASNRFIACILPLGGFLAVAGFSLIFGPFVKRLWLKRILMVIVIGLVIYVPFTLHEIPKRLSEGNQVMKESADALRKLGYKDRRLIYFDPKLAFYLHEDPFDYSKTYYRLSDSHQPELKMADSAFLVWDTHFGGWERGVSLEDMLNNKHFKLIDGFVPDKEFKFFTGQNYMSMIFQKVPAKISQNEWIIVDSLDFETADTEEKMNRLADSVAYSGKKSNRIDPAWMYSFAMSKKIDEISVSKKVILRARVKVYNPRGTDPNQILLVLSVHRASGEMYRYINMTGSYFKPNPREWFEMLLVTPLQTDFPEDGVLKVYVWYTGDKKIFADDLILEYLPVMQ